MEAYVDGLERYAKKPGADLSRVASVASFFISRVDTEIDRRLEDIGTPEALALRGKGAVAQGKLAYQLFQKTFSGHRWEALAAKGAVVQRPLWASTSTKNPAYPDTLYVDELIGPDTVNTLPEATIEAFTDHGTLASARRCGPRRVARLPGPSSPRSASTSTMWATQLEREGVTSFQKSFDELLGALEAKAVELRVVTTPPIDELLDSMQLGRNRRLAGQLLGSAFALVEDQPDILDLKIASAALEEMREAFKMFAPYRDIPKVTDLRIGPHPDGRSDVHAGSRRGRQARRSRMDGRHRSRARHHAGRHGGGRARACRSACRSGCRSNRAPTR